MSRQVVLLLVMVTIAVVAGCSDAPGPGPEGQVATLPLTPESFAAAWNTLEDELGGGFYRLPATIEVDRSEAQPVFSVAVTDNVDIIGAVTEEGTVRELTMLSQPAGAETDNLDTLLAWSYFVGAVNEQVAAGEGGALLRELGVPGQDFATDGYHATTVAGDVRYDFSYSDFIGWLLVAAPDGS